MDGIIEKRTSRRASPDGSFISRPNQTARRFSAEALPFFGLATTSKETFCPSLRLVIPARSTALMCTKTSLPPSSGWMKPKTGDIPRSKPDRKASPICVKRER